MILVSITTGIILSLLGVLISMRGLKFARFIIPLLGGITGYIIIMQIMLDLGASSLVAYGMAFMSGFLFALGSYVLFKVAVVLQFATLGYLLVMSFLALLNINIPLIGFIFGVILAVIVGSVAITTSIWNYLIVIGTSINGAMIGIIGLLTMFLGVDKVEFLMNNEYSRFFISDTASFVLLIAFAVWALGALTYQVRDLGGVKKIKDFDLSFVPVFGIPE